MDISRSVCALAGGLVIAGALASSAGASFVQPTQSQEGLMLRQRLIPSRYLYDPIISTITPNTCPRIRLGDLRMAAHDVLVARGG